MIIMVEQVPVSGHDRLRTRVPSQHDEIVVTRVTEEPRRVDGIRDDERDRAQERRDRHALIGGYARLEISAAESPINFIEKAITRDDLDPSCPDSVEQ